MKSSWKKIAVLALVAAAVVAICLPGVHASVPAHGRFKLPFAANLGNVSLPAGDYSYAVEQMSRTGKVTIYQDQKAVGMLFAQSFDSYGDKSAYPVLVFVRHDGSATLRAFKFPGAGTFYYALPKGMSTLVAQQPQLIETIQVQAYGD